MSWLTILQVSSFCSASRLSFKRIFLDIISRIKGSACTGYNRIGLYAWLNNERKKGPSLRDNASSNKTLNI